MSYFEEEKEDLLSYFQPDFGIISMLYNINITYKQHNDDTSVFMSAFLLPTGPSGSHRCNSAFADLQSPTIY